MGMSSREEIGLLLYEYVRSVKENVEKPHEPKVSFEIPIDITNKAIKLTFTWDKSKIAMGHLHSIKDLCSLFKLVASPHDDVKRQLLYLLLPGNARIWFRSLEVKCRLDWELLSKTFYLQYYTPKKFMMIAIIFTIFGLMLEKVVLKLGGGLMIVLY
jgi:hypothetical protein